MGHNILQIDFHKLVAYMTNGDVTWWSELGINRISGYLTMKYEVEVECAEKHNTIGDLMGLTLPPSIHWAVLLINQSVVLSCLSTCMVHVITYSSCQSKYGQTPVHTCTPTIFELFVQKNFSNTL